MTTVSAHLKALRIAPRKVRLVTDAIKGKEVREAEVTLRYLIKKGSEPIRKLLKSAVANARHNAKIADATPLFVDDIRVDEGPAYKRSTPRARGRATMIKKRTSHVTLVLNTKE